MSRGGRAAMCRLATHPSFCWARSGGRDVIARSVSGGHRSTDDKPVNRLLKLADVAGP